MIKKAFDKFAFWWVTNSRVTAFAAEVIAFGVVVVATVVLVIYLIDFTMIDTLYFIDLGMTLDGWHNLILLMAGAGIALCWICAAWWGRIMDRLPFYGQRVEMALAAAGGIILICFVVLLIVLKIKKP